MAKDKDFTEKALFYQEKYNLIKKGKTGIDDETDAFRHAFAAACVTINSNGAVADILGNIQESIIDPLFYIDTNRAKSTNMDLWNNCIGREIGEELAKTIKDKNYSKQQIDDMIADKVYRRMKNGDLITDLKDKRMYDKSSAERIKKGLDKFIKDNKPFIDDKYAKVDKYIKDNKAKLKKLEKPKDKKFILNGDRIREHQEAKRQKLKAFAERLFSPKDKVKEKEFDGIIPLNYENAITKDSKIFTKEMLKSMSKKELAQHKEAINFQREEIGIPTKSQAEKEVSKGGMIHVKAYVRKDGTHVRDYYRTV